MPPSVSTTFLKPPNCTIAAPLNLIPVRFVRVCESRALPALPNWKAALILFLPPW
jgi:hypothetical protein